MSHKQPVSMRVNVDGIYRDHLCIGCGTCLSVCPTKAIEMFRGDIFYPKVDKEKCIQCRKCLGICPSVGIDFHNISAGLFPGAKFNSLLGRYKKLYVGYSKDYAIRYNGASGGVSSSILCNLLKEKIIKGAIITGMNAEEPLFSNSFIATSEGEIMQTQGSKYCPTCPGSVIESLKDTNSKEKFAFVGLPCQILAVRKMQQQEKWLKEKIILTIGLFCSHSVVFSGTKCLLNKFAKGVENLSRIQYRGKGWPGGANITYRDGSGFNIVHSDYWPSLFASYFFTPYRCLLCNDLAAELADVSLGDAWLKEFVKKDKIGTSLVISRSDLAEKILNDMVHKELLFLESLSTDRVIESQRGILSRKKVNFVARVNLAKFLHLPLPENYEQLNASLKDYLGAFLIFCNAFITRFNFTIKIIEIINIKILKKYSEIVLKLSSGNLRKSTSLFI